MLRRNRRNQRGVSLIFLAFSMTALCGVSALAVDEGLMWYARNKAQMTADSAVLAWASKDSTTARDNVIAAYQSRGAKFILNTSRTTSSTTTAAKTFTVYGAVNAPAVFGTLVGQGSTDVPAHATATLTPAGKVYNAVPWGMIADQPSPSVSLSSTLRGDLIFINSLLTSPPANYTHQILQITLKATTMAGSTINTMGNFGAVDLVGASGGNDYRTNIGYNSSTPLSIGDTISTLTGNKVGPTKQGMSDRLSPTLSPPNGMDSTYVNSANPYDDWFYGRSSYPVDTAKSDSTGHPFYKDPYRQNINDDHIGVVPLITTPGKGGNASVTVLGLAVFFIEDTNPSGSSQDVVTGRFVGMNIAGAGGGSDTVPGSTGYASGGGATVVTLSN